MGRASLNYKTESLHGAGSQQAERIMIARQADIENKINIVKKPRHRIVETFTLR